MAAQRPSGEGGPTGAVPDVDEATIAILGGTGDQGRGLAYRLARAGHRVVVGSRRAERAERAALEVRGLAGVGPSGAVDGADNAAAAARGDAVIVAVPWDGHRATLEGLRAELAGKIVIDCVNPLGFDERGAYALVVEEGSAAQQAASVLPHSTVVGAFHHVSARLLLDPAIAEVDADVLVLGDHRPATDFVQALAGRIPGMRGIYAGRLRDAHQVEALTANLIAVNRRYRAHAGFRVTDV